MPGALRIHLTRLSTEGLGPRHGEVRRAHQMLNAALLGRLVAIRVQFVRCERAFSCGEFEECFVVKGSTD